MRSKTKKDLKVLGLCIALFAVVQVLINLDFIGPFWELNLILIGINIILASSLNLINGFTGQFSIGHAGFMAVGAYVSAVLSVKFELPFILAILGSAASAGLLGFLIGLPTLRLVRVAIGAHRLDGLAPGQWREVREVRETRS